MAHKFFEERIPHRGMTYAEYKKYFEKDINATKPENLDDEQKDLFEYKKLNLVRSDRIDKNYKVSEELAVEIKNIKEKQLWMVITEDWCGDSAQNLPYLARMAEISPNIDFRIILRDSNPEIIDLYLTNGTRSIPKLVAFDMGGNELFNWGPRPKAAHDLIHQWKSEGIVKPELYEKLHLWYGRNRGKDIEAEMTEILSKVEQE